MTQARQSWCRRFNAYDRKWFSVDGISRITPADHSRYKAIAQHNQSYQHHCENRQLELYDRLVHACSGNIVCNGYTDIRI